VLQHIAQVIADKEGTLPQRLRWWAMMEQTSIRLEARNLMLEAANSLDEHDRKNVTITTNAAPQASADHGSGTPTWIAAPAVAAPSK
jgi:hypothetical protein